MKDKTHLFLRLPADLHKKLKTFCVEKGISMQKFIEEVIKEKIL